jgi:poly(hydroxyalkanoate) depolymerase family esterase
LKSSAAFGANPGGLEMLSYVPEGLSQGAPLVVVLHGCGQTAAAYASGAGWLTLADRLGFAVLAPQQSSANNPNRCFNWFSSGDVGRGEGEAASIAAMIAFLVRSENLDPSRVFITGLSAGGAMTMAMLASYPDLFAAGAVIAGLPYGVANGVMQAMTAMQQGDRRSPAELAQLIPPNLERYPRLTVWHGGADHVVSPENAEAIVAQWAAAQGLSSKPDETVVKGGRTKSIWRGKTGRKTAIELNLIRGLGHGVPLFTRGEDGVGKTAPYMLEAGVSSSEEIAAFWGLTPLAQRPCATSATAPTMAAEGPSPRLEPATGLGDRVLASVREHVPSGVHDVIATALKQAGLMK